MARIYAEELERRGAKVQLAFEQERDSGNTAQPSDIASEAVSSNAGASSTSAQPATSAEQEVIVLRGGFTRW